jgi:hypothetical protein
MRDTAHSPNAGKRCLLTPKKPPPPTSAAIWRKSETPPHSRDRIKGGARSVLGQRGRLRSRTVILKVMTGTACNRLVTGGGKHPLEYTGPKGRMHHSPGQAQRSPG